jgi:hypothetical protein
MNNIPILVCEECGREPISGFLAPEVLICAECFLAMSPEEQLHRTGHTQGPVEIKRSDYKPLFDAIGKAFPENPEAVPFVLPPVSRTEPQKGR